MRRDRNRIRRTPRRAIPAIPHTGTRGTLPRPSAALPKLIPSKPSPPFTAHPSAGTGRYPASKPRRVLRRSQRDRNLHFSHTPSPSVASAPHVHFNPLRHPFNLRPMLITSRQRSLAFGKVRDTKNAALPDTIGSGKRRVSFRAAPAHSSVLRGCPALFSYPLRPFRPGPCRIQSRTGRGLWPRLALTGIGGTRAETLFSCPGAGPCRDPPPGTGRSHSGFRSHVCISGQGRPGCIQRSADQINDRLNTGLISNGKPEVP